MNIKHNEIVIPSDKPFKNCKLGREKYADALTSIVSSFSGGFVLAINNQWGTGKTTFIKMWQQHLNNAGFKTLYFNAWENDFDSNPLVAFLSELKNLLKDSESESFKSLVKNGAKIAQSILPILLKAVAEKYVKTKVITDAIEKITQASTEILKDEIDEYIKKKKGLVEFRSDLQNFVSAHSDGKPLIFIIDELDRCRPDYAVEVLEKVKHFFNVPGIAFVLSIDKVQLGNAIKGFYGSDQIDGTEYLRRFIDIEYSIPLPNPGHYSEYLYDFFDFNSFFTNPRRTSHHELVEDGGAFIKFATLLFSKTNITLRQQEKIFSHANVVLKSLKPDNYLFPSLFVFLIYTKELYPETYRKLQLRQSTVQHILEEVENILPQGLNKWDMGTVLNVAALISVFYNNNYSELNPENLIKVNEEDNKKTLLIKSKLDNVNNNNFLSSIEKIQQQRWGDFKLNFLLDKIDLLSNATF
jgi:hypothetical protein